MSQHHTEWEGDPSRTQRGVAPAEASSPTQPSSWAPVTPVQLSDERPSYKLGSRLVPSGQVYEAQSPVHPGPLVVKLFPWALGLPAEAVAPFTDEISRVAQLRHPHVVQVFRSGVLDDGTPFTASERLFGETLEEKLGAHGPLPVAEALAIMRGIASAVSAAHAVGVVHRELRADNVFMAKVAGYEVGFPKVLDFGVSRLTGAARAAGRIVAPGTIGALAPEQRQWSLDKADERADQYALAGLTYRLLTGVEVSPGMRRGGPAFERMRGETLGPGARFVRCAPEVEAVLAQAMNLQPENRFQNVAAFFRALQNAGTPLPSPPPARPGDGAGRVSVGEGAAGARGHNTPTVRLSLDESAASSAVPEHSRSPGDAARTARTGRVGVATAPANSLTQQFFVEGDRQEADLFADAPLTEEDFIDPRPRRPARFDSFDALPRRRVPVLVAVAGGLIAVGVIAWAVGGRSPDRDAQTRTSVAPLPPPIAPRPSSIPEPMVRSPPPVPSPLTAAQAGSPAAGRTAAPAGTTPATAAPTVGAAAAAQPHLQPQPSPATARPAAAPPGTTSSGLEAPVTAPPKGPLRGYVWSEKRRRLTRSRPAPPPNDSGPPPAPDRPSTRDLLAPSGL